MRARILFTRNGAALRHLVGGMTLARLRSLGSVVVAPARLAENT